MFFFVEVARAILENPQDKTDVNLIYANVTYDDILLKVNLQNLLYWALSGKIIKLIHLLAFYFIVFMSFMIVLLKHQET
jgi:hypothetical protein